MFGIHIAEQQTPNQICQVLNIDVKTIDLHNAYPLKRT